jgi:murein L,D-transpeptidase YcbB/YkuD
MRAMACTASLWLALACAADAQTPDAVADALRTRVEQLQDAGGLEIEGVAISAQDLLPEFYSRRGFQPVWTDPTRAEGLLEGLSAAEEDGLEPEDYFVTQLSGMNGGAADAARAADRDLLLTEALIRYAYHRRFGKVNPQTMEPDWNFRREFAPGADPVTLVEQIIAADLPVAYLDGRIPRGPWYRRLQDALGRYRAIAATGGWPPIPSGPTLHPGDRDARVPILRERLQASGDLAGAAAPAEPELLDEELTEAVRRFQGRHALATDGVIGPTTLAALNVPVEDRINQLRLSLERARWVAASVTPDFVAVNTASFEIGLVKGGDLVWRSRVVVGREARQTPIFRGDLQYLVLNPTWTIPPTILRKDILPKVKEDPDYLAREKITVLDRNGRAVDPATVNWRSYSRGIPYTLRQEPGPENSLGRIKFMFPNEHSVYLHDTPARQLFEKPERTFSSGCIRVDDPLQLAELVLDDPQWTRATLEEAIATGKTRTVRLARPMPVLILYWTALAEADGTARFFRDIYGRDARLLAALDGEVRIELPGREERQAAAVGGTSPGT